MLRIREILTFGATVLAVAAAHPAAQAQTQANAAVTAQWRGGPRNQELIDQAVRHFGYNPRRLSRHEVQAINDSWTELLGAYSTRQRLTRAQAAAIVYMALVYPHDDGGWSGGRPGRGPGRDPDYGGRPGYGGRPDYDWDRSCYDLERDAYQLGNLVAAPERNSGLFVSDPERGRARALARQIQETAVRCRALDVADQAGEVMAALSATLPARDEVSRRVELLKDAIRQAAPDGRPRGR